MVIFFTFVSLWILVKDPMLIASLICKPNKENKNAMLMSIHVSEVIHIIMLDIFFHFFVISFFMNLYRLDSSEFRLTSFRFEKVIEKNYQKIRYEIMMKTIF